MIELLTTEAPQSPLSSHRVIIRVCLCPSLWFFLCGVITVCPAPRRFHVYPAWVSALSPWESCNPHHRGNRQMN